MITVLFTMKHDKCKVFFPAIVTMMSMHLMSVGFGTIFPLLFSQNSIVYFSVFLFLFFGVMMIYEAYHLEPKTAEEKVQEIQKDLLDKKDPEKEGVEEHKSPDPKAASEPSESIPNSPNPKGLLVPPSNGLGTAASSPMKQETLLSMEKVKEATYYCSNPYLHLVVLLFLADWGDRCQISAIVLTATHNVWGVALGGAIVFCKCVKK